MSDSRRKNQAKPGTRRQASRVGTDGERIRLAAAVSNTLTAPTPPVVHPAFRQRPPEEGEEGGAEEKGVRRHGEEGTVAMFMSGAVGLRPCNAHKPPW